MYNIIFKGIKYKEGNYMTKYKYLVEKNRSKYGKYVEYKK